MFLYENNLNVLLIKYTIKIKCYQVFVKYNTDCTNRSRPTYESRTKNRNETKKKKKLEPNQYSQISEWFLYYRTKTN